MRGDRGGESLRMRVIGVPEGEQLGQRPVGQRLRLALRQRRVCAGGAPHGLGGVVDQDVERPGLDHRVGEADHLGGVAQVDADHAQAVQPLVRRRAGRRSGARHPGESGS